MSKDKERERKIPHGIKPMSEKEANAEMQKYIDRVGEMYKDTPEEELKRGAQKFVDFVNGKLTWGELFNLTPEMMFQIAEYGYSRFEMARFKEAEMVFKALTVLDWNNGYYHSMMGSILQKQGRLPEAIAEYSVAIELDPEDIVSLTNRGEIFIRNGLYEDAKKDLKQAALLDPEENDKFANRARMLLNKAREYKNSKKR